MNCLHKGFTFTFLHEVEIWLPVISRGMFPHWGKAPHQTLTPEVWNKPLAKNWSSSSSTPPSPSGFLLNCEIYVNCPFLIVRFIYKLSFWNCHIHISCPFKLSKSFELSFLNLHIFISCPFKLSDLYEFQISIFMSVVL